MLALVSSTASPRRSPASRASHQVIWRSGQVSSSRLNSAAALVASRGPDRPRVRSKHITMFVTASSLDPRLLIDDADNKVCPQGAVAVLRIALPVLFWATDS